MCGGERGARGGQRVKANSNMDGGREGARGGERGWKGARGGREGGERGARGGERGREGGERGARGGQKVRGKVIMGYDPLGWGGEHSWNQEEEILSWDTTL